jgi:hypothetical protein
MLMMTSHPSQNFSTSSSDVRFNASANAEYASCLQNVIDGCELLVYVPGRASAADQRPNVNPNLTSRQSSEPTELHINATQIHSNPC